MCSHLKIRSQRKLNFLNNTESRVLAKKRFWFFTEFFFWYTGRSDNKTLKVFETSISKASFCFLNQPEIWRKTCWWFFKCTSLCSTFRTLALGIWYPSNTSLWCVIQERHPDERSLARHRAAPLTICCLTISLI